MQSRYKKRKTERMKNNIADEKEFCFKKTT